MLNWFTILLAVWLLAGCDKTVPVPSPQLAEPHPDLMSKIKDLPPIKGGDDLVQAYGVCRADYGRVAHKARGLQGYVNVIHNRKE